MNPSRRRFLICRRGLETILFSILLYIIYSLFFDTTVPKPPVIFPPRSRTRLLLRITGLLNQQSIIELNNTRVRRNVKENYANCLRTLCYGVNKGFPLSHPSPSATEERNAYTLLRCVMIIAWVNLIYAVTPVWKVYPHITILDGAGTLIFRQRSAR